MKIKILSHQEYAGAILKKPTEEVKFPLSEENNIILDNMIKVMYQANGIGLAANQIGHNKRMFVMDTSNEKNSPQVFINPILRSKNNIKMTNMEGCLSCPGEDVKVKRSITVNLEWTCRHGKSQHKTFSYLPSRVVQHEMDHLDGKLIIDENIN
jgi:peptide deformylase